MIRLSRHRHLWFLGASVLIVLAIGAWAAHVRGDLVDRQMRRELLEQATDIALSISPETARALTFTAADADATAYRRLRGQMIAYAAATGQRSLYSLGRRDGQLRFGPESLPEAHPWASPPGTPFQHPSAELVASFDTPRAFTEGPLQDEYGTFISALAPVIDPISGAVLMVVGLDMDARAWQVRVNRERSLVAALAMAIATILLVGAAVLHWRDTGGGQRRRRWHPTEAALAAVVGVAISSVAAWAAHDSEQDRRRQALAQTAQNQVQRARDLINRVRYYQLGGLVRLHASSENVTATEFLQYALPLVRNGNVRALGWVDARAPQTFVRLVDGRAGTLGVAWRISADSAHAQAVHEAIHGKVATISAEPETLPGADGDAVFLLAQPLPSPPETGAVPGAAVALVQPEELLGHPPQHLVPEPPLRAALHRLHGDGSATRVACAPVCPDDDAVRMTYPLFIHGEAFALELGPGPSFHEAHPVRAAWTTAVAGLALTALLVAFVSVLNRRRADLEQLVSARTADLAASEARLRDSEQRQQLALAGADLGLWDWHIPSGRVTVNERWAAMIGRPIDDMGASIEGWHGLVHPEDLDAVRSALDAHLRGETPHFESEHRLRHLDGHWLWVLSRGKVMERAADGTPLRAVGTHLDISDRKATEEELRHLANYDPLTELPNRRHFLETLQREIERFRRFCQPAALLMLDLDDFKHVNDTYGHAAGDQVLQQFSALIQDSLRKTDHAGRLGGEEFAILLPGSDEEGALQFAERLRRRVADAPMNAGHEPLHITVSIGLTLIAGRDVSPDNPLARCDQALYRAKAQGRDRVVCELP